MGGLTDSEVQNLISNEANQALTYIDTDLQSRREAILDAIYMRMPNMPARRGRSSVVDGTVSSQIDLIMPGLMRVLTGGAVLGEYVATDESGTDMARQASDFVNEIVLQVDNSGDKMIYDWGYDGLTQIVGCVKSSWKEEIVETTEEAENLSMDQLVSLAFEIETMPDKEITAYDFVDNLADGGELTHSVTITTTVNKSRVIQDNIPPEEFVVSADARTLDDAVMVSHRSYKRAGELIEMGYSKAIVDTLPTYEPYNTQNERLVRGQNWSWNDSTVEDQDLRKIAIHQGILRCNRDGKGLKPWYFVAAGNTETVALLEIEEYAYQVAFATFCPKPIPHTIWGRCPGDDLVPIQEAKTAILRQTMDNLYLSNTPQRFVNKSRLEQGGLEAVINAIPGGIVLTNGAPGDAVYTDAVPFFAEKSFGMLEYQDREAEKRTGVSRANMALDPDSLSSQTATASRIAADAGSSKVETMARIWANGGMTELFRNTLNILREYQDFGRVVRIGGESVEVNPADWSNASDWQVTINTGLGTGSRERDLSTLDFISQKQEAILQEGGLDNGLVTVGQYAQTLRDMVYAAGFRSPNKYFENVPLDAEVPQEPPPGPSPDALAYAEVENNKMLQRNKESEEANASKERIEAEKLESADQRAARQFQIDEDRLDLEREKFRSELVNEMDNGPDPEAALKREAMLLDNERKTLADMLDARTRIEVAGINAVASELRASGRSIQTEIDQVTAEAVDALGGITNPIVVDIEIES
jgi:hypothetical protein